MAHSLSNILLHVVFSTWQRHPWLRTDLEGALHGYMASTARAVGCACLGIGSADDHVHVLCRLSRTITAAKLVQELKTGSSRWLKTLGGDLSSFGWQEGYGAFSVGRTEIERVRRCLMDQRATTNASPTRMSSASCCHSMGSNGTSDISGIENPENPVSLQPPPRRGAIIEPGAPPREHGAAGPPRRGAIIEPCAGHVRHLGGESPLPSLTEAKG